MLELTPSQENYLESIFRSSQDGPVRVKELAAKVGVKEPSVSRAVTGLAKAGLVRHEVYGKIELTDLGMRVGESLARRSDCLDRFLVEILSMPSNEADAELHRLEHVLSDGLLSRLEILVDFAASSPAWVKRLHHRLRNEAHDSEKTAGVRIGAARVHGGSVTDKVSKDAR